MIGNTQCLYGFYFLYGGAIITLFVRAFVRRDLLKDYENLNESSKTGKSSNKLLNLLLAVPQQAKALRELKKSITGTPDAVQQRYKRFQILTWVAIALVILLVIYSATAHKICGL